MMAGSRWRVASSLDVLLKQLNAIAPKRSKVADGSIGDAAHAGRSWSFHNPDVNGVVRARDFTHDPRGGLDGQSLADALTTVEDPRLLEVIWNHRYWTPKGGWVKYNGPNPHTKHVHVSVVAAGSFYDDASPWRLPGLIREEDILASIDDLRKVLREQPPADLYGTRVEGRNLFDWMIQLRGELGGQLAVLTRQVGALSAASGQSFDPQAAAAAMKPLVAEAVAAGREAASDAQADAIVERIAARLANPT